MVDGAGYQGIEGRVQMPRVRDVAEAVHVLRVWRGMRDAALVER